MAHPTPPAALIGPVNAIVGRRRRRASVAVLALAAALCAAGRADAGVTLVSRDTSLEAGGTTADGRVVRYANGSTTFERFADSAGTGDGPLDLIAANAYQYSAPGTADGGATGADFRGVFAEGSAGSTALAPGVTASARSDLRVAFRVEGGRSEYTLGGALGATGDGWAVAEMHLVGGRGDLVAFVDSTGPGTLQKTGWLEPGDYELNVRATTPAPKGPGDAADVAARDAAAEDNSAYYSVSLSVASPVATPNKPPAAVPLPPAALAGGGCLGLLGVVRSARRRRRVA